jgi:Cation transporting ATPase, C-terminus
VNGSSPARLQSLFENRVIVAGVAIELVLIAAIDYTRWGQAIFGTADISFAPWLVGVPFAAGLIGLDRFAKRHRHRPNGVTPPLWANHREVRRHST